MFPPLYPHNSAIVYIDRRSRSQKGQWKGGKGEAR